MGVGAMVSPVILSTLQNNNLEVLLTRIESRTAQLGIIGMGYVGLPLSIAATNGGFPVLGFDIDPVKVEQLTHNISPLRHIGDKVITEMNNQRRFAATADFQKLGDVDAIII